MESTLRLASLSIFNLCAQLDYLDEIIAFICYILNSCNFSALLMKTQVQNLH
jgi:hypothetical protein